MLLPPDLLELTRYSPTPPIPRQQLAPRYTRHAGTYRSPSWNDLYYQHPEGVQLSEDATPMQAMEALETYWRTRWNRTPEEAAAWCHWLIYRWKLIHHDVIFRMFLQYVSHSRPSEDDGKDGTTPDGYGEGNTVCGAWYK